MICKLDLQAGGTYKGRSLRYLNFALLLMFTVQHTMYIPKSALIVFTCYRLFPLTVLLSITNGAEILEIKIDHWWISLQGCEEQRSTNPGDRGRFPFNKNSNPGLKFRKLHVLNGTVHSGCTDPTQATARFVIVASQHTHNYALKEKSKYCLYPKEHSTVEKGRWKT